jgi:hypothetical protein
MLGPARRLWWCTGALGIALVVAALAIAVVVLLSGFSAKAKTIFKKCLTKQLLLVVYSE